MLGGTGDEPSSHWLEIVPRKTYPSGATIRVGVDARANFPGEFIEIPQVRETAKYITMNYSEYEGFPAPITNGGLNEFGVAARDVWSSSRRELQDMTPKPQHGVNYSDLSRIVMERAHSAREAVEIVGNLIDRYGYATYGGNSHFFADARRGLDTDRICRRKEALDRRACGSRRDSNVLSGVHPAKSHSISRSTPIATAAPGTSFRLRSSRGGTTQSRRTPLT